MILGAGYFQVPVIETAKNMGLKTVVIDKTPNALGSKIADFFEPVDLIDFEGSIKIAKKFNIDGVIVVGPEAGVRTMAAINQTLGLPGISLEVAEAATNKFIMRQKLSQAGLANPVFKKILNEEEITSAIIGMNFPLIMKPIAETASRGITIIKELQALLEGFKYAQSYSPSGEIIIEEFMDGPELTVEALVYENDIQILAISDKYKPDEKYRVSIRLDYPSELPEEILQKVHRVVKTGIKALGIKIGAVHTEVIVTKNGPQIVEIAARATGGIATHIVPYVSGVKMVEEMIKMAIGLEPDIQPKCSKAGLFRFFFPPQGKVISISGIEEAKQIEGILDLVVQVKPGDIIGPLTKDTERAGHIIAVGDTREIATIRAEKAEKTVKINVAPE